MSDAQQAQRPETRRVTITAADFNGHDWDGSPFSEAPSWLAAALRDGRVKPIAADCDYALWDVQTGYGVVRAEPGDEIRYYLARLEVWRMQPVIGKP